MVYHSLFFKVEEFAPNMKLPKQIKKVRRLYYDYHEALSAELSEPFDARALSQTVLTLCDNAHRLRPTPETSSDEVADLTVRIVRRIAGMSELSASA